MGHRSSSDFFDDEGRPLFSLIAHDLRNDNPGPAKKALEAVATNYFAMKQEIKEWDEWDNDRPARVRELRRLRELRKAVSSEVLQCPGLVGLKCASSHDCGLMEPICRAYRNAGKE